MILRRRKAWFGKVNIKTCADGSVIRWRRCLQCDSLIVFRPHESVRQVCDLTCKRALSQARSKASGRPDWSSKIGRGPA
jgi:hypothetical protein